MSNRLIEIGHIPLIPDPIAALKASAALNEAIDQTKRIAQYMSDFFAPSTQLVRVLRRFGDMLDRATYLRDLSVMDDRELQLRGVERHRIRDLLFGDQGEHFVYRPNNVRAGDMGR